MKDKKKSISRILIGVLLGCILLLLIIRLFSYLRYSNLTIAVIFKPGIDELTATSVLLKYGAELKAEYISGDKIGGYMLVNEISPRIKGFWYLIKIKLDKNMDIKAIEYYNRPFFSSEPF